MSSVRFDRVSKRFTIHHERPRSFQDLLVSRFGRNGTREEFWALQDVSFAAEPGTALGIVGANGSGKSTLLKLATRILAPTAGTVTVTGRVSALLELGAGFHPELSGRDNVFLNASIMGMRRRDVAARFDAIVRFAGLERFIDSPVKHYSSGQYARLGFAVAMHVDPDVLLIDEVLSVGDESFHERCLEAIFRFHRAGKTLLMVSHDLATIRSLCTEAIWLDQGRIRARGDPGTVVADYFAAAHGATAEAGAAGPAGAAPHVGPDAGGAVRGRWGSGEVEILSVSFQGADGRPLERVRTGDPLTIQVGYRAHQVVEEAVFGLAITTGNDTLITGPNTRFSGFPIEQLAGDGIVRYCIDRLDLLPGEYWVSASIYDQTCTHPYDYHDRRYAFTVAPGPDGEQFGLVRLPARWSHQRCGP